MFPPGCSGGNNYHLGWAGRENNDAVDLRRLYWLCIYFWLVDHGFLTYKRILSKSIYVLKSFHTSNTHDINDITRIKVF